LGVAQPCQRLADHRLAYLDYQGELSGDRGTVTRWDQGDYELRSSKDDTLELRLSGARLRAVARLTRQEGDPQRWVLDFLPF
jgi:hypothetical protein